jgi:hypothetical protein
MQTATGSGGETAGVVERPGRFWIGWRIGWRIGLVSEPSIPFSIQPTLLCPIQPTLLCPMRGWLP